LYPPKLFDRIAQEGVTLLLDFCCWMQVY